MPERIAFVPFYPEHLAALDLSGVAERYRANLSRPDHMAVLCVPGLSWTCFANGRAVGCAGIYGLWPHRASAWALFGVVPRKVWPAITGKTIEILDQAHVAGFSRIETTVIAGFAAGRRWAARLGFACETPLPMRAYAPDGTDHFLYARVRP